MTNEQAATAIMIALDRDCADIHPRRVGAWQCDRCLRDAIIHALAETAPTTLNALKRIAEEVCVHDGCTGPEGDAHRCPSCTKAGIARAAIRQAEGRE